MALSYETIRWLGMCLDVPSDWQIVRHGIHRERGRLTFTDRYAERLDLTWQKLESAPELDLMVSEQRRRDERDRPNCRVADLQLPGWCGYRWTADGESLVRAARYEGSSKQLLEAVLVVRPKHPRSAEVNERLITGVRSEAQQDGHQRFCAFDVDIALPDSLQLVHATVQPANVQLEFEAPRVRSWKSPPPARVVLRRMGMASTWYHGNAVGLLERESPHVTFDAPIETRFNSHLSHIAEGDATRARLARWVGRALRQRSIAWLCQTENAVYHVATTSSERQPLGIEDLQIRCCKEHAR